MCGESTSGDQLTEYELANLRKFSTELPQLRDELRKTWETIVEYNERLMSLADTAEEHGNRIPQLEQDVKAAFNKVTLEKDWAETRFNNLLSSYGNLLERVEGLQAVVVRIEATYPTPVVDEEQKALL